MNSLSFHYYIIAPISPVAQEEGPHVIHRGLVEIFFGGFQALAGHLREDVEEKLMRVDTSMGWKILE